MLNKNMNPSNAKTQSIHYYSSGKFNLFHCYKYTNCLYCENFHFLQPLFLQKGSFIFFFSFFYTSHLSKCQPLILAALLVYPLNLNLFLNLLVLILTTIEFYYFYSKKSIQNIAIPICAREIYIDQFPILCSFLSSIAFSLSLSCIKQFQIHRFPN